MDLENVVANSLYLRARHATSASLAKRRRRNLAFPLVQDCADLACYLEEKGELSYLVVMRQPIGRREFYLFCEEHPRFHVMCRFIEQLIAYEETVVSENQLLIAYEMYAEYLDADAPSFIKHLDIAEIEEIKLCLDEGLVSRDLFANIAASVNHVLATDAFRLFRTSLYFARFLQWKMLEFRPVSASQFRTFRVLGRGGFGEVYAAQRIETGRMYAMKRLNKALVKRKNAIQLAVNERNLLAMVDSKFVVGLVFSFQTKTDLFLVVNLMNSGDLGFHLSKCKRFDEVRAKYYAAQILLGLQHLQRHNIVYRDMKPENVLLDEYGNTRISDLGLALIVPPGKAAKGRVGTPGYMAPEVVSGSKYAGSVDWWGLGCVLFEMLQGHNPFRNKRGKHKIMWEDIDERVRKHEPVYDHKISEDAKDLCQGLLQKTIMYRLGCESGAFKACEPDRIKKHPFFRDIDWPALKAGLLPPPFYPDVNEVYAKDVTDLAPMSRANVTVTAEDEAAFSKFDGITSKNWQRDMLEDVFEDLNPFSEPLPVDLQANYTEPRGGLLRRVLRLSRKPKRPRFDRDMAERVSSSGLLSQDEPSCALQLGTVKRSISSSKSRHGTSSPAPALSIPSSVSTFSPEQDSSALRTSANLAVGSFPFGSYGSDTYI
eukprot:m.161934 g.161934  ORF g.161934 m.161934 type:complete len:655 (-) comp10294_c0_seq1:3764-5728(-)